MRKTTRRRLRPVNMAGVIARRIARLDHESRHGVIDDRAARLASALLWGAAAEFGLRAEVRRELGR